MSSADYHAFRFVRDQFLTLDSQTLNNVAMIYGRKYGAGPLKYFRSTYPKWRAGTVGLSGQTEFRILQCVPKFLSSEKQFKLLCFYIPEFMTRMLAPSHRRTIHPDAVPAAYCEAVEKIQESSPNLCWFVSGIFSEDEIENFADVARYMTLDRLYRSYAGVRLDLLVVGKALSNVDAKISLVYKLDDVGGEIDLRNDFRPLPERAFKLPSAPLLVEKNRNEYERLLLDHYCEMRADEHSRMARHDVARLDLTIVENAISSLQRSESVSSDLRLRGAGGTIVGTICRKNLDALRLQLCGRIAAAFVGTLVILSLLIACLSFESTRGLGLLFLFGALGVIPAFWTWVHEKRQEVLDYERGRTRRITEVQG